MWIVWLWITRGVEQASPNRSVADCEFTVVQEGACWLNEEGVN